MTAAITPRLVSEEEALVPEPSPLNPETLQGLAARVQAATGQDKGIEAEVVNALYKWGGDAAAYACCHEHPERGAEVMPLTASLDAALALVERIRPDWYWIVRRDARGLLASVTFLHRTPAESAADFGVGSGRGQNAALALLVAFLKALATEAKAATPEPSSTGRRENQTSANRPEKPE